MLTMDMCWSPNMQVWVYGNSFESCLVAVVVPGAGLKVRRATSVSCGRPMLLPNLAAASLAVHQQSF
jgi:hypothetical protein